MARRESKSKSSNSRGKNWAGLKASWRGLLAYKHGATGKKREKGMCEMAGHIHTFQGRLGLRKTKFHLKGCPKVNEY